MDPASESELTRCADTERWNPYTSKRRWRIKEWCRQLHSGSRSVNAGIQQYLGENGELNVKVTEYVDGVNKVVKGVEDYTTGASQLSAGITSYIGGEKQLAAVADS